MRRAGSGFDRFLRVVAGSLVLGAVASAAARADDIEEMLTNVALLRATAHEAVLELLTEVPLGASDAVTVRPGTPHKANWIVSEALVGELNRRGITVHVIDLPVEPAPVAAAAAATPTNQAATDASDGDPTDAGPDSTASDSPEEGEASADDVAPLLSQMTQDARADAAETAPAAAAPETPIAETRPARGEPVTTDRVLEFRVGQFEVTYVGVGRSFVFGPKRVTRAASVDVGCRLVRSRTGRVDWVGQGDAVRVDRISKSQLAAYESADYAADLPQGPGAMRYVEPVVVGGIVAGLVYLFYTNQN